MPPFQSRSTGAWRIARIRSTGGSAALSIPSTAWAWGEIGIDFAVRGHTPPPCEITDRS